MRGDGETSLGYGDNAVALWVGNGDRPVTADMKSGLHFCFDAPSRESVAAFHEGAMGAGGKDNGQPGYARLRGRTIMRPS